MVTFNFRYRKSKHLYYDEEKTCITTQIMGNRTAYDDYDALKDERPEKTDDVMGLVDHLFDR